MYIYKKDIVWSECGIQAIPCPLILLMWVYYINYIYLQRNENEPYEILCCCAFTMNNEFTIKFLLTNWHLRARAHSCYVRSRQSSLILSILNSWCPKLCICSMRGVWISFPVPSDWRVTMSELGKPRSRNLFHIIWRSTCLYVKSMGEVVQHID